MRKNGFTLVEILVVIAISAILGIVAFVNLKGFGAEQTVKNAALDWVGVLRTAQTNATTSVKCNNQEPLLWQARFSQIAGRHTLETLCQYRNDQGIQTTTISSKALPSGVLLDKITGSATCSLTNLSADSVTISFAILSGKMSFSSPIPCFSSVNQITVGLQHSRDANVISSVIINKGGAIYVQ